jgi:methyl coenzyme M reductase subunit C-like uncharacterized protein (methanogenesis marker protein 7)
MIADHQRNFRLSLGTSESRLQRGEKFRRNDSCSEAFVRWLHQQGTREITTDDAAVGHISLNDTSVYLIGIFEFTQGLCLKPSSYLQIKSVRTGKHHLSHNISGFTEYLNEIESNQLTTDA